MTVHVGPDGDTLGSMLGLKFALEKSCPHIETLHCVVSGKIPDVYSFLPGIDEVQQVETSQILLPQYDLSISVDCGSADRLGNAEHLFTSAKTSVNIDHHISNKRFGSVNIIEPTASATGEMVFDILPHLGASLDANIAPCLYTAIVTDTGGFKYSNTTPKVLDVAARLVEAGADPELTFKQLYEEQPRAKIIMQADALLNTAFNANATIGWSIVSQEMLKKHGALEEYVDGLVESIRRIDSILVACVLKENGAGTTKISVRSDTHAIDVAEIMGYFGGGGHKMAAGCTIEAAPQEALQQVLPHFEKAVATACREQLVH